MVANLTVVGVRHHSPACARLVEHVLATERPRFVLIEGPSDLNDRLDELLLAHELPIAVYTYRLGATGAGARGCWSPFCAYSPEWVALARGRAQGADVRFIDLPAWDDAFAAVENRYSDAHLEVSERLGEIARDLGFDCTDTLWDHLFEQPNDADRLERELATYFEALRADEDPGEGDRRREAWMARWIGWALRAAEAGERVVVVCGGYHKPALEALVTALITGAGDLGAPPTLEPPGDRVGSYLVPFSFRRLDSFTGYASGMPSPEFYQAVWDARAEPAGAIEGMLHRAASALRAKGQWVSSADLIAASELTHGLARLRGHRVPARADLLDGITGALVKEALTAPPPWTTRGTLPRDTDPILVEIVRAFSGKREGKLAPETPRPPLVHDVLRAMDEVGLGFGDRGGALRDVEIDPLDPRDAERRVVLYRLAVLQIPVVLRTRAASFVRGSAARTERWQLGRTELTEPTLIERAVYGATLEHAAAARLGADIAEADGARALADLLERATLAGFEGVARELSARARDAIAREQVFADACAVLGVLLSLVRAAAAATGGEDRASAYRVLTEVTVERALWLLEATGGPGATVSRADVLGVGALATCVREEGLLDHELREGALATFARRASADHAPPAVRGACVGALWSCVKDDAVDPVEREAIRAAAAASAGDALQATRDEALGDFLGGLFAVARDEFLASPLLGVVDVRLAQLERRDFLVALPSLRRAFSFFPPRERLAIAKRLVQGTSGALASDLLRAPAASAHDVQRAAALEDAVYALAERYGLLGGER